jgi:DNA polymerase-3 subunit delta'
MGWDRVFGHELQKSFFQRILALKRVHHAYLLSGPSGIGKRTLALEVAKVLLCLDSREESCNRCKSCKLFERSLHPDFFFLNPEGDSLGIEAARDLVKKLSLKRVLSPFRVGVIDEAEKLTEEAANCLLKTVEEPKEGVVLFIVTSRVSALPETLISRCQKVVFSPLSEVSVEQYLREEKGLEPDRARFLALLSGGSIGQALFLASRREGILEEVQNFFKGVQNPKSIFELGPWLSEHREDLPTFLSFILRLLRDALFLSFSEGDPVPLFNLPEDVQSVVQNLALWGREKLLRSITSLETFLEDLSLNVQWDIASFHFLLQFGGEKL